MQEQIEDESYREEHPAYENYKESIDKFTNSVNLSQQSPGGHAATTTEVRFKNTSKEIREHILGRRKKSAVQEKISI